MFVSYFNDVIIVASFYPKLKSRKYFDGGKRKMPLQQTLTNQGHNSTNVDKESSKKSSPKPSLSQVIN